VTDIPTPAPRPRPPSLLLGLGATAGYLALALSLFAVLFWVTAEDEEVAAAGAVTTVDVALGEFAIDPTPLTVGAGGTLAVTNGGSVAHNLAVEHTDLVTADLSAGDTASLSLEGLAPGDYTVACLVPGHADAGMRAPLTVTEAGAALAAGSAAGSGHRGHGGDETDWAQMQADMLASMAEFPAETEGVGNQVLEPTEVLPDGTKVFDLVAAITEWEVAPGEIVEAWTYNGTVPAPSIRLAVGDRARFRLTNDLSVGTDLHLHGLNVEHQFDGVAPISQDLVEPGETFTYEYTADEVAVAMYHPHFMSQVGMPNGMFGTIFVGDEPLPLGRTVGGEAVPADLQVAQRVPMVLNDAGTIGYSLNGKSFPATAPIVAAVDDWVEITYFNEGTQVHPMHLHEFDQIVVARDGFPLDNPYVADVVTVAPGERYTVLVHLDQPGTWVYHCHILPHVEDDEGMFGMVTAVVVQ
jgi:FtsP/CotA-like multicopper oxidase with cupredoxin domain